MGRAPMGQQSGFKTLQAYDDGMKLSVHGSHGGRQLPAGVSANSTATESDGDNHQDNTVATPLQVKPLSKPTLRTA